MGTERTYLHIIKAFYDKPTANVTLNGEKPKAFLLKSGTKQGCPLTTFLHHNIGSPSHSNQTEKEIKGIQMGREEVELSLYANASLRSHSVVSSSLWPMDCGPPGSSGHGLLQARVLEWVATSSSRGSSPPRDWTHVSCVSCIAGGCFITREAHVRMTWYYI